MSLSGVRPPFDQFRATAEAVVRERPEADLEIAREVFDEAATLLDNSLALEGLDEYDASAVVAGLCIDLVAEDPGAAIRTRSKATLQAPGGLHDPGDRGGPPGTGRRTRRSWSSDRRRLVVAGYSVGNFGQVAVGGE